MLIECPECHERISDQAEYCIHCGYPIKKRNTDNLCEINGISYDLSEEFRLITQDDYMQGLRNLRDKCNLELSDTVTLANIIKETKKVPKEYNSDQNSEYRKILSQLETSNPNIPKCPTCGSTNVQKISVTSKAVNTALFGIFGTKRHKNYHCNNCKSDF
ncbi:zinc-ribbon domain-containing protein [Frisingicoccus sp.]|uniref:zinc-ribbon domain-containing protein n=1 Tax=Frisingicoccus sp. TaxID=1918627 RepID=UPI003AB6C019